MRRKPSNRPRPRDRYWETRIGSKAFKRALTVLVRQELESLSAQRVQDMIDAKRVSRAIREWDGRMLNRQAIAEIVIHVGRRTERRLRQQGTSLLGLLDRRLAADVDAILSEEMKLSSHAEALVAKMMRQEFVRGLFTDIIFTSIVSFYQKVNPLFGALAMRALEDQIKGFIRLFMPIVQEQAIAFAVDESNQRIFLDFTRAIVRQLLDEPLRYYAGMVSPRQRKRAESLVRKAANDAKIESLVRRAALAAWSDVYEAIRGRTAGDLLRLDAHAPWLAERAVEMILPALWRPRVLQLIAAEAARAAAQRH